MSLSTAQVSKKHFEIQKALTYILLGNAAFVPCIQYKTMCLTHRLCSCQISKTIVFPNFQEFFQFEFNFFETMSKTISKETF